MSNLSYEFTVEQRKTLDRYMNFLGSLPSTFNHIPLVFELRRKSGHHLATLAADSRLNNAAFHLQYLQGLWRQVHEIKLLFSAYLRDLETFTRECLEITQQTSRSELLDRVDFRLYSLSSSPIWKLFPPRNVSDLVHELHLRFRELNAAVRQLKYVFMEVHSESFGLSSVFTKAMAHRSCNCHLQPAVAEELFQKSVTTPAWDITYSSSKASVRAAEYTGDIASLFKKFVAVNSQMGLSTEALYQRVDGVVLELTRATYVATLGQLNFRLNMALEGAHQSSAMINKLEAWLRK